jgi:hypothetical protein
VPSCAPCMHPTPCTVLVHRKHGSEAWAAGLEAYRRRKPKRKLKPGDTAREGGSVRHGAALPFIMPPFGNVGPCPQPPLSAPTPPLPASVRPCPHTPPPPPSRQHGIHAPTPAPCPYLLGCGGRLARRAVGAAVRQFVGLSPTPRPQRTLNTPTVGARSTHPPRLSRAWRPPSHPALNAVYGF